MVNITTDDIRGILEDFAIYSSGGSYVDEEGCLFEEFSYRSPLGEDFGFTLHYVDNAKSLAREFGDYAENFDPEEHAAMWYNNGHPAEGTPSSLRDLLEDAEAIKENLFSAFYAIDATIVGVRDFRRMKEEKGSDLNDVLLDALVRNCDFSSALEVVRDRMNQVRTFETLEGDAFRVRFGGGMFQIAVKEVNE